MRAGVANSHAYGLPPESMPPLPFFWRLAMTRFAVVLFYGFAVSLPIANSARGEEAMLRVGIVGCDTSHVIAFTNLINDAEGYWLAGQGTGDRGVSRRQSGHRLQPRSTRRVRRPASSSAASRSSIPSNSLPSSRTPFCWKASTAVCTWNSFGPSPAASRCSSTSQPPPRWPTCY